MSAGDSGARPNDSKLEPNKDVGAALYELEKQEKTFEKELKKFTTLNRMKISIGSAQTTKEGRATERALILQLLVTRGRWSDIHVCALHVTSQI